MANVLICSSPIHGHVTPLLVVARYLAETGHAVRFLTGSRYRDAVEAAGAIFVPLPAEADYDDRNLDTTFPGRVGKSGVAGLTWELQNIFLTVAGGQYRALDQAVIDVPTDAVIAEPLFVGAVMMMLRPPSERPMMISSNVFPLGLSSRDTAPFGLGLAPIPGLRGRVRNRVLQVVAEKIIFRAVQRKATAIAEELVGTAMPVFVLDSPRLADALVQFSVPGFEYPRSDLPGTVHFVGPMLPSSEPGAALPSWWADLDAGRPVVHVTQGTIANQDYDALIVPTVTGLADDDVLVVVSTGSRPVDTVPGPLPANVRVAEYLPYDALLPKVDVMVTNGGFGGIQFAMRHGVPLVVAGTTEDKIEVTARVAWSGVGINLKTDAPTSTAVRDAVRTVLADGSYREASARIGTEILASSGLAGVRALIEAGTARPKTPASG